MINLRKLFTAGLIFVTIFAMSVVVAPKADASASAGDLIKMNGLSSVYYLAADGKRYVFPNESTYYSWYADFSGVVVIPQSELEGYALGANITVRPGTFLVKITTNPNVFAVEPDGNLVKVPNEATAAALYGANWAKKVIDVPDSFFTNYTITNKTLTSSAYPVGQLIKMTNSPDVYLIGEDGKARKIASEAAFLANRFQWRFVVTAASTFTLPALGDNVTGAEEALTDVSQGGGGTGITPDSGTGVTAALAGTTPASATIPSGATGVIFTNFNLTASNDGAVTVTSITVKRTGVGAPADFAKVYLYAGSTRLTSGRTFNTSTNEVTFSNLGLALTAGQVKSLSIVGDLTNTAGGNHALGIASASAITTNGATVSGSFPIYGNTMSFSNAVTAGLLDVETDNDTWSRTTGEKGVEVADFNITLSNVEDGSFEAITLYNSGDNILSGLKLYRGTDLVAEASQSGDYFVFVLDTAYALEKGQTSAQFTVKGDISGGDGDGATLTVRYNTDIKVKGKTYGYYLGVDGTRNTGTASMIEDQIVAPVVTQQQDITNVQAGQVTFAATGPIAADVSENTSSVALLNFTVTAEQEVEVQRATLNLSGANLVAATDLSDLELICGNVVIETFSAPALTGNVITSAWTLSAGVTECKVVVDLENSLTGNEKIRAQVTGWQMEDMNGDAIINIIPTGGTINGNEMSITKATLNVDRASAPAAGNIYVKGATNMPVTGFTFSAGSASAVKVTSVKVLAYASTGANTGVNWTDAETDETSKAQDVMVAVSLWDGSTQLAKKTLSVGTDEISATFDSLAVAINAGQSKTLTVKADITTNGPLDANTDTIAIALDSVTAEYGTGTGITATINTDNQDPNIAIYQVVQGAGTLNMTIDASTPDEALVPADADGVAFTKVKLAAVDEAFQVNKLQVNNSDFLAVGDDELSGVYLVYKNQAGATITSPTAVFTAGVAKFEGLAIYVPKNSDATFEVKANLNSTDGGADNGDSLSLAVATTSFEAIGLSSGERLTRPTNWAVGFADGDNMTVYESFPTFTFGTLGADELAVIGDEQRIAIVSITANAAADITFLNADGDVLPIGIKANLTAGIDDGLVANVTLKDASNNVLTTTTVNLTSGEQIVDLDFNVGDLTITKGTTANLSLWIDTAELDGNGDTIRAFYDATATTLSWGINGDGGNYDEATMLFKNNPLAQSLMRSGL